jgi:excisionase family DNA binding protein
MNGQPITQTGSNNEAVPAELLWLTMSDVTARVRCGRKIIYRAVAAGKLRAAVINARGDLRFRHEWVDAWLDGLAQAEVLRTASE